MRNFKLVYLIGFILIPILFGIAAYLQLYKGFNPCGLCILQRAVLAALGVIFFFGATLNLKKLGHITLAILSGLVSFSGALLAGRQIWLQYFPPIAKGDCGVSLQYMLHIMPWNQVLKKIIQGGTECSQVGSQFLNLSLAEWSLVWFVIFTIGSLVQLFKIGNKTP